ncbi:MAG: geranylgeranylglycerol-phosphate geranylgeranyltransferase [Bacteroidales bacterium]
MMQYLRLIRFKNLLIIALTMCLMRYAIIAPQLKLLNLSFQFSAFHFILLVIATMLITAAGYVINDYFDTKTDMLNHPGKVTVGKSISRRLAIIIHFTLNILGAALGVYISFYIGIPVLSFIFLMIPGILWFYSTTYKRQFLIGNIIVAFLTALVPLMVLLFEVPMLTRTFGAQMLEQQVNLSSLALWIGGYAVFAFILTLVREIVKDIEDFEGDNAFGRKTLPIELGVNNTVLILDAFILLVIGLLVYLLIFFVPDILSQVYVSVFVIFPLAASVYLLHRASDQKHYHRVSSILKLVMLSGVMYSLLAWYIFTFRMG